MWLRVRKDEQDKVFPELASFHQSKFVEGSLGNLQMYANGFHKQRVDHRIARFLFR